VISIFDPENPDEAGYFDAIGYVAGVFIRGTYAYVTNSMDFGGFWVLDISEPGNPVEVGSYRMRGNFRKVMVSGDYAYISGWEGGLKVMDISDPENPELLGSYNIAQAIDVFIRGDYDYLTSCQDEDGGLRVIDVSDPANPTEIGKFETQREPYDVFVSGNYAYVNDHYNGLYILDVSTLSIEVPDISIHPLAMNLGVCGPEESIEGRLTVRNLGNDDLTVMDIITEGNSFSVEFENEFIIEPGDFAEVTVTFTPEVVGRQSGNLTLCSDDPNEEEMFVSLVGWGEAEINEVGFINTPHYACDVHVIDNFAYVADYNGGLRIIDINDPENPDEVGFCNAPNQAISTFISNGFAYVANGHNGLYVIDVSDPENPFEVGRYATQDNAKGIFVSGDYVYVADEHGGLRIFSVIDPENLEEIGFCNRNFNINAVFVSGTFAYLADWLGYLRVIDVSDPVNPNEVGIYNTHGESFGVFVSGTLAYLADGPRGLRVIDVSDPENPDEVGFCDTPGSAQSVFPSGDYAYLADGREGLRMIDISDPQNPVEVGNCDTPDHAGGVRVLASYAFLADAGSGFRILEIFGLPPEGPDIAYEPDELDFGNVQVRESRNLTLTLLSQGDEDLIIGEIDVEGNCFNVDFEGELVLPVGENVELQVVFAPEAIGEMQGRLIITSNDPNRGLVTVDLVGVGVIFPEIATDPPDDEEISAVVGFGEDPAERILTIVNTAVEEALDLEFVITHQVVEQERDRGDIPSRNVRGVDNRIGPHRDRAGEVITTYNIPYQFTSDLAWDGELMWGSCNQRRLIAIDPENGEVEYDLSMPDGRITFDGENLWIVSDGGVVRILDRNGDIIDEFNVPITQPGGMASDREDYVFISKWDDWDYRIFVYSIETHEFVTVFDYIHTTREVVGSLAWGAEHQNGNLWVMGSDHVYQLSLDEDWNAELVSDFEWDTEGNRAVGLVHDGVNLWHGMWEESRWYVQDDGIAEGMEWLTIDPVRGSVPPGEEIGVTLTFDPEGLETGTDYYGDLLIESNDPENPFVTVHLRFHIINEEPGPSAAIQVRAEPNRININDPDAFSIITATVTDIDDNPVGEGIRVSFQTTFGAITPNDDTDANGEALARLIPIEEGGGIALVTVSVQGPEELIQRMVAVTFFEGEPVEREISVLLSEGWNIISINLAPSEEMWEREEGPDVILMTDQLRIDENNHHILLMKDEDGGFYAPAFGFNNIPYWDLTQGYQVKVDDDVEAVWSGELIPADADIPLERDWNLIAYFPTYELDASAPDNYVLLPIIDHVLIAKNGDGQFMLPAFNFSNMPPWRETQGYQVKVDEDVVLNYPAEQQDEEINFEEKTVRTNHWSSVRRTSENMSILVNRIKDCESGQIAAFSSDGTIMGTGLIDTDGRCGLAVWGDDESTFEKDGLTGGESFELKLWDAEKEEEIDLEVKTNDTGKGLVFETNSFLVIDATPKAVIPDQYYLSQNFPNPFNSTTHLTYGCPENSDVLIKVIDMNGRLVQELVNYEVAAGIHTLTWEANNISAGIYLIQMETSTGFKSVVKVMLIK